AGQRLRGASELELVGRLQFVGRQFQRVVVVLAQLGDALRVYVEADRGVAASEGGRQRQPHVAQPDHGDADVVFGRKRRGHVVRVMCKAQGGRGRTVYRTVADAIAGRWTAGQTQAAAARGQVVDACASACRIRALIAL